MKKLEIKSIVVKKYQYQKNQGAVPDDKENILNRDFSADTVFKKLVTDITYIHVVNEGCYLASVTDLYDRKIIGWAYGKNITAELATEPTPEEKPKSTNMLPAILTLIVLACGGGFFVFKKVQEKKKAQEAAKPDPDADYVDDDEDYGYDPEFEDDDADSSVDEDDNEPV